MSDAFGNLFAVAMSGIPTIAVSYSPYTGQTQSEVGTSINTYGTAQTFQASVQPVKQETFHKLGLQIGKKYKAVYMSANVRGVSEIKSPDKLVFGGKTWIMLTDLEDWFEYDGWRAIIVVAENEYTS